MKQKQPTTLTTLSNLLIFSIGFVVGMHFANLPHRLPQPTTFRYLRVSDCLKHCIIITYSSVVGGRLLLLFIFFN